MEIWAKSNGVYLKKHIEDMLNASEKLLERVKNQNELKKLLKWAIFFHDLGKVSPSFQKRIGNTNYIFNNLTFPDIRHNILSIFFINKDKVKEICEEKESIYATFLSAIAFHHWKKDENEYLLQINKDLIEVAKLLLENGLGKNFADALKQHFDNFEIDGCEVNEFISFDEHLAKQIEKEGSLISVDLIPPYNLYFLPERLRAEIEMKIDLKFWILLSGFLMRIDHFVSFVEKENNLGIQIEDIEKTTPNNVNVLEKLKNEKNLSDENLWQKKIIENRKNKNLILIAPTGIGKTEFALVWAEGEKFFYTLPLRVATNQIFERVCKYFNNSTDGDTEDPYINGNVGLLHSDADLYLIEKAENSKKDIEGETLKILDLSRYFSLPVNICTGDQIFPACLKYPQYEKIYSTLGYSKLIIDEVQAYDPKACAIVVKMIEDVVSLGGKFLLMTATLPEFVKEYLQKKGIIEDKDILNVYDKGDELNLKIKVDYRHRIELKEKDIIEDIEEIINKAKEGKRVLVVLNTIEKAEAVYKKIEEDIKKENIFIDLLHSRFTLNKRKEKEKKLEEAFKNPKPKEEKSPKILVATQVVEASLDIDADYLFTEIAPMDSLIQRMGRVMRRVDLLSGKIKESDEEFKYENFYNDKANVFIYYQKAKKENQENIVESGKGYVYEKELLKKTYEILNKKSEIKENEKQKLVEKLYSNIDNPNYLMEFDETISVLNGGYVSENKEEAHRIFREIYTVPLIEEIPGEKSKVKEIINKIKERINQQNDIDWIWFKKEIIAEYVINDYLREKEYEVKPLWKAIIEKEEDLGWEEKLKKKIERYCEGIWVYYKEKRMV